MKNLRSIKLWTMILCMLIMISVPLSTIIRWNTARASGLEYSFKCQLLDPVDYLRGRYVALDFQRLAELGEPEENYKGKDVLFATLKTDKDGLSVVDKVYTAKPSETISIKVRSNGYVQDVYPGDPEFNEEVRFKRGIRVHLPFDRYYLEEKKAPVAEEKMREFMAAGKNVYLKVKIWNNITAPIGLYVEDKRIEDVL